VAVVGRPNVGKSTLVNRIAGRGEAIVERVPGVTRDRLYLPASWNGVDFLVVDTGGLDPVADDGLSRAVGEQALRAVREADLVLFVVDAKVGVTPLDQEVADVLRREGKPVLLVANKVDNRREEARALEFYSLGMGEPFPVSAMHGRNVGDLLDLVTEQLPPVEEMEEAAEETVVAIVGKPNAGKSTLFNRLIEEERAIVSEVPGTTRDAVDTVVEREGRRYRFIDTAGWRRRAKVKESVEFFSLVRVWRAIDRAQVVLLVIDASQGVTDQDQHIAARIQEDGRACVLVLNKWDLIKGKGKAQEVVRDAEEKLHFVSYAPLVSVSALTGKGVEHLFPIIDSVRESWLSRVKTSSLNSMLREVLEKTPPPSKKGKKLNIYYVTQARTAPPHFVFFVNDPDLVTPAYSRFLEKRIRELFGFLGAPIRLTFRPRPRRPRV
jgi:GTP-binding protein